MVKKYTANSIISISVLTGFYSRRVSFIALSNNKSYFVTGDKKVQDAIEKHPYFKKGMITLEKQAEKQPEAVPEQPKKKEDTLEKVYVAGQSDAVEFMSEHYGISRSKLRSQKAINEAAASHGIVFVYN